MTSIKKFITRFAQFDCGSVAIEYGLLAGLVSVAIIAGSTSAGTSLNTLFTNIGTKLTSIAANAH